MSPPPLRDWHLPIKIQSLYWVAMFIAFKMDSESSEKESKSPDTHSDHKSLRSPPHWVFLTVSLLYSLLCFEYVSLCYRMDYSFAVEAGKVKSPMLFQRMEEKGTSASSPNDIQTIQAHASTQPVFDKPYYYASMAAVLTTAVGIACLVPPMTERNRILLIHELIVIFLNLAGVPIVCLFVMALAYWRGEVRKVWGYGERWMDEPKGVPAPLIKDAKESAALRLELESCDKTDSEKHVGEEMLQIV